MNHILDDFSEIIPDFLARESDFSFDLDISNGYVYDMRVSGIKLKQLDITKRVIKIIPGAKFPSLVVDIGGIDFEGHVTGGLEVGPFQMFNFTEIKVKGLKLGLNLGIVTDKVN